MSKITVEHLESLVKDKQFHVFAGTTHTVCLITLHTGFTVSGESACVNPADFNRELGEEIAYKNAFDKLWELEGYLRKSQLSQ